MTYIYLFISLLFFTDRNSVASCGEEIFFSNKLSKDSVVSCSTCHDSRNYFQDSKITPTIRTIKHIRNTPSLLNIKRYKVFTWDGHETNLADQVLKPLNSRFEFKSNDKIKIEFVANHLLVKNVDAINIDNLISDCLLKYLNKISTKESKFEGYLNNKIELNHSEEKGFQIFMNKGCVRCHNLPNLTDNNFYDLKIRRSKNVLTIVNGKKTYTHDLGRGNILSGKENLYKFRTPTLYNVLKTAPYMHDGSFAKIDDVLEFYSESRTLKIGKLSNVEKKYLISFFETLNEN